MNLTIQTIAKKTTHTIGRMYVNGTYYCDTLEPPYVEIHKKEDKLPDGTAIPEGNYPVQMEMSKNFRRSMPFLMGVPWFSGVMIHPGNTVKDTLGCILPGKNTQVGTVTESRKYFEPLRKKIIEAIKGGKHVVVTVRRNKL